MGALRLCSIAKRWANRIDVLMGSFFIGKDDSDLLGRLNPVDMTLPLQGARRGY